MGKDAWYIVNMFYTWGKQTYAEENQDSKESTHLLVCPPTMYHQFIHISSIIPPSTYTFLPASIPFSVCPPFIHHPPIHPLMDSIPCAGVGEGRESMAKSTRFQHFLWSLCV